MIAIFISSLAIAQAPEENPNVEVIIAKETVIDFNKELDVNASANKPSLEWVSDWKPNREGSLIQLRTTFQNEMNISVNDIK